MNDTAQEARERVQRKRARRVELMQIGFNHRTACLIVDNEEKEHINH